MNDPQDCPMPAMATLTRVVSLPFILAAITLAATVAVARLPDLPPEEVTCTISTDRPDYGIGEHVEVHVELCNAGVVGVTLPGVLDGSERHRRLPWVDFRTDGVGTGVFDLGGTGCGFLNPLNPAQLIILAPGQCFDPYEPPRLFWPAGWRESLAFACPGRQVLTFHYSTLGDGTQPWLTNEHPGSMRLDDVPAVDVTCSTEITITSRPVAEIPALPLPLDLAISIADVRKALQKGGIATAGRVVPFGGAGESDLHCRWCPSGPGCVDVAYWRLDRGERIWGIVVSGASERASGRLGDVPLSALLPEVLRILGPPTAASSDQPRAKSGGTGMKRPTETRLWLGRDPSYRIDFATGCGRISSILAFSPSLAPDGCELVLTRALAQGDDGP